MTETNTAAIIERAYNGNSRPTAIEAARDEGGEPPAGGANPRGGFPQSVIASVVVGPGVNQASQRLIEDALITGERTYSLLAISAATSLISSCADIGETLNLRGVKGSVCAGVALESEHGLNIVGPQAAGVVLVRF